MSRIAIVTQMWVPGGAERQIKTLCRYVKMYGHTAKIYSILPKCTDTRDDISYPPNLWLFPLLLLLLWRSPQMIYAYYYCGMPGIRDIKINTIDARDMTWIYSTFAHYRICFDNYREPFSQIIGFHFQTRHLLWEMKRLLKIPVKYIEISSPKWRHDCGWIATNADRWFMKSLDVIVPSKIIGKELVEYEGMKDPYHIIPMVLDMPEYHARPDRPVLTFGVATRLSPEKNIDLLIEVMEKIRDKNPDTNTHLNIIGDGPDRERLESMVREKRLDRHVTLFGSISRLESFIDHIDIVVLLSDVESVSATLLESLYFGKPIICTDVGANRDLVIDGYNGYIVKKEDINGAAEKVIEILTATEKYVQFSINSREMYLKKYRSIDVLRPLIQGIK